MLVLVTEYSSRLRERTRLCPGIRCVLPDPYSSPLNYVYSFSLVQNCVTINLDKSDNIVSINTPPMLREKIPQYRNGRSAKWPRRNALSFPSNQLVLLSNRIYDVREAPYFVLCCVSGGAVLRAIRRSREGPQSYPQGLLRH